VTSSSVSDSGRASERATALTQALEVQVQAAAVPGAQAAVVFGDGSTWQAGAGLAADGQAMSPTHLLAYGSVSKVHTAVLILTLAQAGVLDVDDTVGRWINDAAPGITLRQLLTHTSGLASDDVALDPVCRPVRASATATAGTTCWDG
jgi:CubicO group peptidase (beta-lactamase class C family)